MTLRKFIESGIDLSWNPAVYLSYQKFPYRYIKVDIPVDDMGYSDKIRDLLLTKFCGFLGYDVTCITCCCPPDKGLDICIY